MSQLAGQIPTPQIDNDAERVAHLCDLGLLDSPPEPVFDRLTGIARDQLEMGHALLSLVDADRQWFKSIAGPLDVHQTPRRDAFCAWAILTEDLMVVEDASVDPRFARNPLVLGEPYIRFYAGVPIVSCGHAIGTLCVLDRRPRRIGDRERRLLEQLAATAAEVIELRRRNEERISIGEMLDAAVEEAYLFDVHADRVVYANAGGRRRSGFSGDELERLHPQRLSSAYDHRSLVRIIDSLRAGKRSVVTECHHLRRDGSRYPVETRFVRAARDGKLSDHLMVAIARDITARKEAERELAYRAHHDNLTGLANRYLLEDRFDAARRRLHRGGAMIGLAVIDLDRFKEVNDTWGHDAGDAVLVAVSALLASAVRQSDTAARVGGDEFVILFDDVDDRSQVESICDRLRESLATLSIEGVPRGAVSASIGYAMGTEASVTLEALMKAADTRMYAEKRDVDDALPLTA